MPVPCQFTVKFVLVELTVSTRQFTVTVKVHVSFAPAVFVAVQVTVVVPGGNVNPEGGLQLTVKALLHAVATKFTGRPCALAQLVTMFCGQIKPAPCGVVIVKDVVQVCFPPK